MTSEGPEKVGSQEEDSYTSPEKKLRGKPRVEGSIRTTVTEVDKVAHRVCRVL